MRFEPGASHERILAFPLTGRRHLFACGGYGGGKSAAVMRSMVRHVSAWHHGDTFAVLAKSKAQLSSLSGECSAACSEAGLRFDPTAVAWRIEPFGGGDVNVLLPTVFGDAGATGPTERIQGLNLAGCLVDEAPNMGEPMRRMLLSRLRVGRCPFGWWSMNPDSPRHPFKTQMIDNRALSSEYVRVPITDNPSLPDGYVEDLRASLPLAWMQARYIDGEWAGADGLVWPGAWEPADQGGSVTPRDEDWTRCTVGVDWATRSVSHAVLIGSYGGTHHAIAEWRHDARSLGELTEPEQAERILAAFRPWPVDTYVVDRTSHGLILALRERAPDGVHVRPGRLNVDVGVANVASLLAGAHLTIDPACGALITEMSTYCWPPLDQQPTSGPVKPLKRDDHGCDALRYGCENLPTFTAGPRPAAIHQPAHSTDADPLLAALRG